MTPRPEKAVRAASAVTQQRRDGRAQEQQQDEEEDRERERHARARRVDRGACFIARSIDGLAGDRTRARGR